jgi:hypothetical protein
VNPIEIALATDEAAETVGRRTTHCHFGLDTFVALSCFSHETAAYEDTGYVQQVFGMWYILLTSRFLTAPHDMI